jgi:hypothetical protein
MVLTRWPTGLKDKAQAFQRSAPTAAHVGLPNPEKSHHA